MTQEGTLAQKHQENLELKRVPFLKTDYVGILMDSISDTRVRKALSLSIDRAEFKLEVVIIMTYLLSSSQEIPYHLHDSQSLLYRSYTLGV